MHANSIARFCRHLTITFLAMLFISACGEGDGQPSIAGTPAPPLSGILVDAPVSGVSWATTISGLSGMTDAQGTFQYQPYDSVTFSIGGIVLGTVPGAPVISAVELTGSNNPTDQPALNMLVFLQSIDADSNPSNGIMISDSARANAASIALDFSSADFATQIAAVVGIIAPGNTVVNETDALNNFYITYAALGGTDTFAFDFPGYPPVGGGASFELVFFDEFNAGTAPDPTKWNYETGYGSNGWGNNEWQLYTESPDNVRVEGGNLVISALCPTAPCGIRDGSITSGKINTLGKFNFKFGKIQARIKPPTGKAAWPAFWSLGTNFPEIGWPRSGEIDFMEVHNFYSDANTTHFTMHWRDQDTDRNVFDSQFLTTGENLGDDFHIFEADWNEDRIIGKIDGQTYFTRQIEPGTMEEFLEEFYMILNVAMGGTLGSGNQPPAGDETFPQTMLVDYVRVFQGSEGSGGGGDVVLANFDDVTPDISEFGGAAPAIEAGPEGGDGNALKITRDGGEVFAGVFLSVSGIPSDGGAQTVSALVYSPTAGIPFVTKLEYEENVGTGDVQANETVVEGWQTLTWTYNLEAGNDYTRFVILPNLGEVGAGEAYYIDNITLLGSDGGDGGDGGTGGDGSFAAITFDDAGTTYTLTDFGGTASSLTDDPAGGANQVAQTVKSGPETWAGTTVSTGANESTPTIPLDASNTQMTVRVYSPAIGITVRLKVEDASDDTITVETEATTTVANAWETLTFDFANPAPDTAAFNPAATYNKVSIFFDFGTVGSGETYYFDDIDVVGGDGGDGGTGGGDAPTVAAETPPARDAANVVSLFSDAYTDVTVDTWQTDWSNSAFADVEIAGNATKEYTSLNYVGIETVAEQIDATGMTHFHVDVWTPNAETLEIKLVDFGANGAYDGPGAGDDTEGSFFLNADSTPPAQGEWLSLDIPLADFEADGLTTRANIAQLIFAATPSDDVTLYVDNVYFHNGVDGGGGTGGGDAPTVAAPTPTQDAADVISLFSDGYTNESVTWPTEWSVVDSVSDVTIEGGLVKEHLGVGFVGIEFPSLDVSGMTHFHMDVYTPDADSLLVKIVDFGGDGFGGGNDSEGPLTFDGTTTPALTQGEWISLDIPLSDMQTAGLANLTDINQLIFDATPDGTIVYVDNVYFYNDAGGGTGGGTAPTVAAATPTQDAADVISLFSDAYTDVAVTWPTVWSAADSVSDVTIDGGLVKEHLGVGFVGIEFASLDVSGMTHFHMDVWTPDADSLLVKIVDFGGDGFGGGNDSEGPLTFDGTTTPALTQGEWISLDIPLSDMQAAGLASLTDINQLIFDATPDGTIVYVDNVYFYNDAGGGTGGGTAPTVAAATPTQDAADVISLYSDAYTDIAVTWPTVWSAADSVSDVTIDGGLVKEHLGVGFVGIEFASLDVSGMTHFHMDVWTPDADSLLVKIVDFGGDGFGGGNDSEGPLTFDGTTTPALTQGTWVSLDIPLSDMQTAGLASLTDINQLIFDATPDGTIVYVDNVYFYNDAGGGTGGGGTFVNGDFETGDLTGWTVGENGTVTLEAGTVGGVTGNFGRLQTTAFPQDVFLSQVALAAGTVAPGDSIDVSFDLYGSLTGAGGVVFVEVIFLNGAGEDVGGRDFVGPAAPYFPSTTWTNYGGTVTAGTATGGVSGFDVSGGVTLQLKAACGGADCSVDAYFDNVTFVITEGGGGTGGGDAPTVAAPTPTQDAADVISLFSDGYTNESVTWPTVWSAVDSVSDVTIEGGLVKEHLGVGFVGIEFPSLDVSGMTHFHMDVYTPDADSLLVKIVDFGGDGFGGGNDSEGPLTFDGTTTPALTQGEWISLDIPLSDMQTAGLANLTDINQLIFDATPDGTIVYVDNVYFYNDGGGTGGGTAPTVAAATPAQDAADVISLFSDAYTDVAVTWPTVWSAVDSVSDVTIDGGLVKEHLGVGFVGIEFASLDVSGMTHFHMDVWTPDADSLLVKIVDFGGDGFGGGNDSEGPLTFDGTTTPALTQGEWISLDIPLSDMQAAGLANLTDINQLIFDATPDGTFVYVDNVYFYNDAGGGTGGGTAPTVAAATPTQDAADVISLYSDAYTDVAVTWPTVWSAVDSVSDVTIDGGLVKEHLGVGFVGIEFPSLDVSGMTHFHMDVWTPDADSLLVKIVDFGGDGFGGGNDSEGPLTFDGTTTPALTQGTWVSLDIPLSDMQTAGLASLTDINQLIFDATPDGTIVYVDNVYFYNDAGGGTGGGTAPTVAAATPTQDATDVISLYSDAYTDVAVTWPTVWSAVDSVSDVTIDGGLVKEHLGVGFVGIEFPSLDVSGMTHFHMDVWTPDADSLLVKIVDFGGDGFGGGNDSEGPLTFDGTTTPALTQGTWVSLDIPLSDMQTAGLANLTDINQLIFDATPDGTIVYVDNVYFYNDAGGGTGGGGTFVNGDFETGDLTGWTVGENGTVTLEAGTVGGVTGNFGRLQTTAFPQDVFLSQVALAAGTVAPGDSIDVSFDLYGSLTGAGGVVFVEVIFLNGAGEDVGGRDFVGPAAPYFPSTTWTNYGGTVTAGTATGGVSGYDVSGGVTLQLKAACGGAACSVDAYFDNVTFVVTP